MKKTTLRRELERDAIAVYDLDLVVFDDYDRDYSLVTVASLAHNWGPHNGKYRGRQISGPFKSIFDIPLYLPDDPKTGDLSWRFNRTDRGGGLVEVLAETGEGDTMRAFEVLSQDPNSESEALAAGFPAPVVERAMRVLRA